MNKFAFLIIGLFSFVAIAQAIQQHDSFAVTPEEQQTVTKAIEKLSKQNGRKIAVTDIQSTSIPGILQVTSDLSIFYITSDGKYLFLGEILDPSQDKKNWSLTELAARKLRKQAIAKLDEKDMIIFPATNPKIGAITVFTDIDCPYCRKMQEHIKEYTDAGIEVRYLAFPRTGLKTKSYEEAVYVWCAKDKPSAYIAAIEKKEFTKSSCVKNPVAMEFELGQKMGISGTPTVLLDNGVKIGGFIDAKNLQAIIKEDNN